MITKLQWTCARLLRPTQHIQKRGLVGLATAWDEHAWPTTHSPSGAAHDDRVIRSMFDSQPFWRDFSSTTKHDYTGRGVGLLQNKFLTSPKGFQDFADDALRKCQRIVAKVLAADTIDQHKLVVTNLDTLSDQLCRVIDLVDFIRNVHPSATIQEAAGTAHARMYEYMNVLNTTQGLADQLNKVCAMPEIVAGWSEEERVTAAILSKDFAQSAIDGSDEVRARFVDVSNSVVQIGQAVADNMAPNQANVKVASNKLHGMNPILIKQLTRFGTATIPSQSHASNIALRTVHDPEVRKQVYMANKTASKQSIANVEALIMARAELATLSKHQSFAHMTLSDKMAKSPEAVVSFLDALAANNKPNVDTDIKELQSMKQAGGFPDNINAWDREYYSVRLRNQLYPTTRPDDVLAEYFSLGTVMQGLSRLFNRLYGVRLVPHETVPGETWNDDIRRLDVIDEDEGHIAVIYCDLFQRPDKSPNPAHFTLRCSREITSSEIEDAINDNLIPSRDCPLSDLSHALNDGMAINFNPSTKSIHQIPTIGFICDFPRPSSNSEQPTLLPFRHVTTLFHEMGHCIHSILGRTTLQNIAGTRCATDFAELPSVLMEHFAASPSVLALYARHWSTDRPLPTELVAHEIAQNRRIVAHAETESQILLSVLDQRLHSTSVTAALGPSAWDAPDAPSWDSSAAFRAIWADPRLSAVPEPPGTSWQGFFGHLFQYGAVYYSYLFDRAIAARLWRDVFAGGEGKGARALERRQGQLYRDEVLKWGGGRDPWKCVAGVLGPEKSWMQNGGKEAMEEVGRWGTGDEHTMP